MQTLVRQGRRMQFLSREEAPAEIAGGLPQEDSTAPDRDGSSPDAPELALAPIDEGGVAERHLDSNLQTLLTGEALQTRLVNVVREARSAIEEQGYNMLFLIRGMVECAGEGVRPWARITGGKHDPADGLPPGGPELAEGVEEALGRLMQNRQVVGDNAGFLVLSSSDQANGGSQKT
jgi:hypothetical protein